MSKFEDEDIENADNLANVDPAHTYAQAYSTQAQTYALISIAKTLRRLETLLDDRITVGVEQV